MNRIRAGVIATLLAVWCFPMVSSAKAASSEPESLAAMVTRAGTTGRSAATPPNGSEAANLEAREQQSRNLQDFKGGGVSIYIGSGALFVALIIILILIL